MNDKIQLPERYIIPESRIPKPWSQGPYDCCVAASITKVLEVINYVKTGTYTMMSKGCTYAMHSRPDKTQGGMDYTYAMNSLMQYGTVPEEMFPIMDEIPDIIDKLENHPNKLALYDEARKTKVFPIKIKGDIHFYDNVKKYLVDYNMPLVGNMVGKNHCTVIVGWDGDNLLYVDHRGTDDIIKGKFNEAYYLDGGIGMDRLNRDIPFNDVSEDRWSYKYIKKLYDGGVMYGVAANKFDPTKPMTREEFAAALCRALYKME